MHAYSMSPPKQGSVILLKFYKRFHLLTILSVFAGIVRLQVDAIEKLAMLNTREVRTILHVLFQQGYLSMQELPRTADRTPSKTVFLYHVRFESALAQLRRDLCTAAGSTPPCACVRSC